MNVQLPTCFLFSNTHIKAFREKTMCNKKYISQYMWNFLCKYIKETHKNSSTTKWQDHPNHIQILVKWSLEGSLDFLIDVHFYDLHKVVLGRLDSDLEDTYRVSILLAMFVTSVTLRTGFWKYLVCWFLTVPLIST